MPSFSLTATASCAIATDGGGVLDCQGVYSATGNGAPIDDDGNDTLLLLDAAGNVVASQAMPRTAPNARFTDVADGSYQPEWRNSPSGGTLLASTTAVVACQPGGSGGGTALVLDYSSHTDETAAGHDGTATIQASGGVAPLTARLVETGATKAATADQPVTFPGLAGDATYTLRVTDSSSPAQQVQGTVTVAAYVAPPPVATCQDEYADNDGQAGACTYSPRWRSAWGPAGVSVRVAAVAGQVEAFVTATLRAGFRPGHPLAASRPLVDVATLRATVAPDGYATFVLGPYLRPLLGAPDGAGGYRLDLNSPTAYTTDLFVGYELRRVDTGALLEHGYALNAAVPDGALLNGLRSPFAQPLPVWPGSTQYPVSVQGYDLDPRYGLVEQQQADDFDTITLPCPCNPLPVAWLAPGGGYGFWVFQGRPALADVVQQGSTYREAATGELRYSERGEARRSYTASSGPFRGAALAEGLATLARSPQVWVQVGGEWRAVSLEAGTFPVQRWGVSRNEISVTFTEAAAWYAQGQ